MAKKYIFSIALALLLITALASTSSIYAAEDPKIFYKGQELVFDQSPFIENGRTLVPIRAIAEAVGMQVDYNSTTKTATLIKSERILKIPFEQENPYVDGKTHIITITIDQQTAVMDGVSRPLDVPAKSIGGRIYVPLRFVSEAMDMDVIWMEEANILISDRLRGSEPLQGEKIFPTLITNLISALTKDNSNITLGMDVMDMQAVLGSPKFVWGRGDPAPNLNYLYDNESIVCCLGKVSIITIGPESNLKTGAGIEIGSQLEDIIKSYSLSQNYVNNHSYDGGIELLFCGNNLYDDYKTATHVIDFHFTDDSKEVNGIEIVDFATLNQFGALD